LLAAQLLLRQQLLQQQHWQGQMSLHSCRSSEHLLLALLLLQQLLDRPALPAHRLAQLLPQRGRQSARSGLQGQAQLQLQPSQQCPKAPGVSLLKAQARETRPLADRAPEASARAAGTQQQLQQKG
jgi:hypothetical protein